MDAYLLLAAAIFGGVVVSLLWSARGIAGRAPLQDSRARLDVRPDRYARPHPRLEPAHEDIPVSEVGPYPNLSARVADLEHKFKLISNEWDDKESRFDALLKRGHRLRKLQEQDQQNGNGAQDGVAEQPEFPVTMNAAERRAEIMRRHRAAQGG